MAINIFSGGAQKSSRVNSASQSSRAQAAKEAVGGGNAVASNSGNTAVKATGTLGKVANVVGNVAGIASKFLPGIGGTIASGLANILNDPEWWQTIPGEQITLNVPLRLARSGYVLEVEGRPRMEGFALRPAFVDIVSSSPQGSETGEVIKPTDTMITQYLLPQIRKVVNAVPLQDADSYAAVFASSTGVYAIWRHLKKCDYLLKHGQTYLPNLNDGAFPVFQVENAAWLQSTINRLEEYLRANVRLPHTLCEYLAWRFGRFYRSCASARAAIVSYSPIPLNASIAEINQIISGLMQVPASTEARQKANSDLYNTYFDHDLMVEIRDDTQLTYDPKEFALRTNCDIGKASDNPTGIPVYLDSSLDNATVFMASTVSTYWRDEDGDAPLEQSYCLFPISRINIAMYSDKKIGYYDENDSDHVDSIIGTGWSWTEIQESYVDLTAPGGTYPTLATARFLFNVLLCKALELYNKNQFLMCYAGDTIADAPFIALDATAPAYDMAVTTDVVIANEQVFAFANLVNVDRKRSMTIGQADKVAAKEVAELVDRTDIATVATPTHVTK
jgi:hypothetical protein